MDEKKNYQQKISQHNECKGNSTHCTNAGSNDVSMSTNSPDVKQVIAVPIIINLKQTPFPMKLSQIEHKPTKNSAPKKG